MLIISVLALINAYVFVLRGEGLAGLGLKPTSLSVSQAEGYAQPVPDACTGHGIRIFEGLEEQIHAETTLGAGDTLRLALLDQGVNGADIDRLEAAMRSRVDLALLKGSNAPIRIAMDRTGGLSAIEIQRNEGHVIQACREDGSFAVRTLQHPLRAPVEVVAVTLGRRADLRIALEEAGEKPELARIVADTLSAEVDFMTEARAGDEVQIIVEKRYLGSQFHRYGKLLAARYRGAGGFFAYYRYKPKGMDAAYFDGHGEPVTRGLLRTPIGFHTADPESKTAMEPVVEFVEGRQGARYTRAQGVPVVSLGPGSVRFAGPAGEAGEVVEIAFDDGHVGRYCHLARIIGRLEPGERVEQGQLIGLVGHSGKAPRSGLRLELSKDGAVVDPFLLTSHAADRPPTVGASIPKAQLEGFKTDIGAWRQAMRSAG